MPRGPRLDAPGILHHVMARGLERQRLFRDDRDRDDFVARLAALASAEAWSVYAWALIPNHFHLLVRTRHRPLARVLGLRRPTIYEAARRGQQEAACWNPLITEKA